MKLQAKIIFKIIFSGFTAVLYLAGIYLLFSTITDFKPQKIENIALEAKLSYPSVITEDISILSWNIGHAGLSKEMDNYEEGGYKHKPSIDIYQKTLNAILNKLSDFSYVDFMLLQEVDIFSNRTFYLNQKAFISDFLPDFSYAFALDENIQFNCLPFFAPLGRVKSGLQTLCKYNPIEIQRYGFTTNFNWPEKLFLQHPCFLITKYVLADGKLLVMINIRHSRFDINSQLNKELEELKLFVCNEYNKGNYVVVGGDWNMNPPGFKNILSYNKSKEYKLKHEIADQFMPLGWQWTYDIEMPSKRKLNAPYNLQTALTTLTDFFLLSPNIENLGIRNIDLDFEYSAHNPVLINIKLK